jgi:hypothetical protein
MTDVHIWATDSNEVMGLVRINLVYKLDSDNNYICCFNSYIMRR